MTGPPWRSATVRRMSRCRECGRRIGFPVPTHGGLSPMPDDGSVAVCLYCGCLSIYTGRGLQTREPTIGEAAELEATPEVVAAQAEAAVLRDLW